MERNALVLAWLFCNFWNRFSVITWLPLDWRLNEVSVKIFRYGIFLSKIRNVEFLGFIFQKCFDHKPRIISKRNKDNSSSCSHPAMHDFEDNKYVWNTISISCNLKAKAVFNTDFPFLSVGQLLFPADC